MPRNNWRPDLSDNSVRWSLKPRHCPYFEIIEYCRHLGLRVHDNPQHASWVGRVRLKTGGYKQQVLGYSRFSGTEILSHMEARELANNWFSKPEVSSIASESYPLGGNEVLKVCPIGDKYTVGHALAAYVDWKRLAATPSNFESLLSVINHHLVPRVANIVLEEFNGTHFHELALDVLETSPKYGRQKPRPRVDFRTLTQDELRKRKKTVNRLTSILRGAFEIAWEQDKIKSDVPMRCLRRLPNWDRPRVTFLDRHECRRLLDACHEDLRPLVLGALYTGCRITELLALQAEDFSKKSRCIYIASPKSRRPRYVFLPEEGFRFFVELTSSLEPTDRIFRKSNGRQWGGEYRTYFLAARRQAELPSALSFHGLRHTYASQLVQAGASLIVVADQLGHANTQTVSNTYGHLTNLHRTSELDRRFEPILRKASLPSAPASTHNNALPVSLPTQPFLDRQQTSWPRANHSKYSGPLLKDLRR